MIVRVRNTPDAFERLRKQFGSELALALQGQRLSVRTVMGLRKVFEFRLLGKVYQLPRRTYDVLQTRVQPMQKAKPYYEELYRTGQTEDKRHCFYWCKKFEKENDEY